MGAIGLFPYNSRQIDFAKMKKTEQWIWKNWKWGDIQGMGLSDDGYGSRPHGRARKCGRSLADETAEEHLFGQWS